ncbi:MAG: hypothetical protein U1A78_04100 [Polyangia bacterium]
MPDSPLTPLRSEDVPRLLTAVEAETAAFVRALLPALDEVPGAGSGSGAGVGPRFHALALEFVIAHGGADLAHAGELHVHVAGSRQELREVHVEQWALARFEARAGTPQPPFVATTRRIVTSFHEKDAASRRSLVQEPYPLDGILDAMGRALLAVAADGGLVRHGFVARPVLSAFTLEELEWMDGPNSVPTERTARLRRRLQRRK